MKRQRKTHSLRQKPHKGSLTLRQGQGTTLRGEDREKRESRERKCSELSNKIGYKPIKINGI